jgi:prepilin-type N-terminal cleavage/methylation domain-containing protein
MKTTLKNSLRHGFTLIELLVVISIIGVLAAITIPALGAVKKSQYKNTARVELKQIEAAIDKYKAKYGVYPPSNRNTSGGTYDALNFPPLYYELTGVTNNPVAHTYTTLDGATTIGETDYKNAYGVAGIINCTKGSGDDKLAAENFLSGLKVKVNDLVTNNGVRTTAILTSVGGPDDSYKPLNASGMNPFRYNSANPTNSPNAFDLWVDLSISGKITRINNWSTR